MKKHTKAISIFIIVIVMVQMYSFGQSYDPVGPNSNVCPGVALKYTSPAVASSGSPCDQFGWACSGCKNGTIQDQGRNPDGSVWATVIWDNTIAQAGIGNFCGALNVSINAIAQPKMSGLSTVSLCGTGSITLQATVTSTTNITGYVWWVDGTGVSPTGIINTTAPQLTLNYTNWTASSTLSATVSVGSKNSCGFSTDMGPLTAIPRSAWVQLSPGNIDNLKGPFSFSPSVICSTGTMTITNQPAGTNVVWSSGNASALTIDRLTGAAMRVNSFSGPVSISATVSNACGSNTQSNNIWVGLPNNPVTFDGSNIFYGVDCSTTSQTFSGIGHNLRGQGVGSGHTDFTLSIFQGPVEGAKAGDNTYFLTTKVSTAKFSILMNAVNSCGSLRSCVYFDNSGINPYLKIRRGVKMSVYPNPSSQLLTAELTDSLNSDQSLDQSYQLSIMDRFSRKIFSTQSSEKLMEIPVSHLPPDIYYLNVIYKDAVLRKQVIIKR
jgi:Secretion system C-terminal sorting domain